MTTKRSRDQIGVDILASAIDPITKTAIRLQQGMSSRSVEQYLLHLTRVGFIGSTDAEKLLTTAMGVRYLVQHDTRARGGRD